MGEVLATRGGRMNFYTTSFIHHAANRTHSIWMERVGTGGSNEITYNGCIFTAHPIVIGDATGPFHFTDCFVAGGGDLFAQINRVGFGKSHNGAPTRGLPCRSA